MRKLFRPLKWRRLSKGGRGATGRVVLWTKGAVRRRLIHPSLNYTFRHTAIGFVATFKLIPFQNKLTALIFLGSGGATYLPVTTRFRIFSFIRARGNSGLRGGIARQVIGLLHRVKLLSKVSLLELYPGLGVQYVRSGGVFATMVRLNLKNHTGVVRLPSGVKKAFSLYSLVTFGPVALKDKRRVRNTRSGY
jgi:ribosomal protein L2